MNWLFRSSFAIAAGVFLASASPAPRLVVGQPAPNFTLFLTGGVKVKLSELRGQVVVLNFWATWCVPCQRELPLLDTYHRLRHDRGLRIYAVATEDSVPAYKLKKLFAIVSFPQALRISGPYDVKEGVPTNYVIGRDGTLRYAAAAAFDLQTLNEVLVPLLNEPAPPDSPAPSS